MEHYYQIWIEKGLLDERLLIASANLKSTDGLDGRYFLMINQDKLFICEAADPVTPGKVLRTIFLPETRFEKGNTCVLFSRMQLLSKGQSYCFRGFPDTKKIIFAVRSRCLT